MQSRARAWQYLRDELAADVALVQEAVPPDHCEAVYKPVDPNNPRAKWGSAVVVLSSKYRLNPRTRRPLGSDASQGELLESHPGASAVADVVEASSQVPRMVAVSFYGAWEYLPKDPEKPQKRQAIYSVAASHRTLSDLTPLLVWARRMPHKLPVLLAGDFNATTQIASENFWEWSNERNPPPSSIGCELSDCTTSSRVRRIPVLAWRIVRANLLAPAPMCGPTVTRIALTLVPRSSTTCSPRNGCCPRSRPARCGTRMMLGRCQTIARSSSTLATLEHRVRHLEGVTPPTAPPTRDPSSSAAKSQPLLFFLPSRAFVPARRTGLIGAGPSAPAADDDPDARADDAEGDSRGTVGCHPERSESLPREPAEEARTGPPSGLRRSRNPPRKDFSVGWAPEMV